MPRTTAEWVRLWFDVSNGRDDPRELVRPLLWFNRAPDETYHDGDVEVFVVEQQGVWLWGRNRSGEFVERENDDGIPWRVLDEDAEAFWLHHAAFEAISSMPATRSAQQFDDRSVAAIVAQTLPLPCGRWTWPGTSQWMRHRDRSLVMVCEDDTDYWIVVAARSEADLAWVDDLGLTWDEVDTSRDGSPSSDR